MTSALGRWPDFSLVEWILSPASELWVIAKVCVTLLPPRVSMPWWLLFIDMGARYNGWFFLSLEAWMVPSGTMKTRT